MTRKRISLSNIIFILVVVLLIIPQTRQPIQVILHKGLAMFSPSIASENDRKVLHHYNWQLQALNGDLYNLTEAKDKVLLINFWATWCPPCIAEMPSIQKLYNDYSGKIDMVLVSDEKEETIQNFLNKKGYSFKIYKPISNIPEILYTNSIPRTLLIDKQGHIIIDKTGAANWNSDDVRKLIDSLITY